MAIVHKWLYLLLNFTMIIRVFNYKLLQSKFYTSIRKATTSASSNFADYSEKLGLDKKQIDKLNELAEVLTEWNSKVNLVSRKDIDLLVPNHILPCLSIHVYHKFRPNERVIDVGTGGGLPGVPMAIMNPHTQFTLLDSNEKKMKVVQDIVTRLELPNVRVVCMRAEEYREKFDYILGRAVSALPNFLTWSSHLIDHKKFNSMTTDNSINNNNNDDITEDKTSDKDSIYSGLLYLKGGDFTDELLECNINPSKVQLTPVTELMSPLESDKFVLYIPQQEIEQFYRELRKRQEIELIQKLTKSRPKKRRPNDK